MGLLQKMLPSAITGAGVGALGYVIGGVASPYVAGVSAEAYGAIGFLLAISYGLLNKK